MSADLDFFDLSAKAQPQTAKTTNVEDDLDLIFGPPGGKSTPKPLDSAAQVLDDDLDLLFSPSVKSPTKSQDSAPQVVVHTPKTEASDDDSSSSSDENTAQSPPETKAAPSKKKSTRKTSSKTVKTKVLPPTIQEEDEFWGPGLRTKPESSAVHMTEDEKASAASRGVGIDLANFPSVRKFLLRPLRKGLTFQAVITRQKAGFLGKYPTFELHADEMMGDWAGKFLMCAKRQVGNKTSNYHISMDRVNFDPPSKSYIGKLRSNFLGTEHVIYDDGVSPDKEGADEKNVRLELGAILYAGGVTSTQPRDMTVVLPEPTDKMGSTNILARYSATSTQGLTVLQQLKPRYNEKTRTYNLNFHGRVKVPSVKNFILANVGPTRICDDMVNQTDEEGESLLFGKINANDQFHMDVRWPLSPMQAFAICVSCFEST